MRLFVSRLRLLCAERFIKQHACRVRCHSRPLVLAHRHRRSSWVGLD